VASAEKLSYVKSVLSSEQGEFFRLYKEIIFAAARFDMEHPLYSSFLYSVGKDSHNPALAKMIMTSSISFVKYLLGEAHKKGQIRKDVDLDFAAFIISYLSVDVGEYIADKYNYSYLSVLKSSAGTLPVTDDQLSKVLDELIDLL
jgi:hypothetical protein